MTEGGKKEMGSDKSREGEMGYGRGRGKQMT